MLSLPHTPQALVVMKFRFAATRAATDSCPGLNVTAATLSSHILISCTASSRPEQSLGEQEPGRQVDVVPWGAHRHGERLAVHPDLQRLLGREQVGPVLRDPVHRDLEHPPPGRRTAHTTETNPRKPNAGPGGRSGPAS